MKCDIKNDEQKGRGYAILTVHFDAEDPKPRPDETFSLAVKGRPSGNFLQPPGSSERWVDGAEAYIPVPTISFDGIELVLELGPYFTDAFQDKMHLFYVKGAYSTLPALPAPTNHIKKPPRGLAGIDLPDPNSKFAQKTVETSTVMNRAEKPAPEEPPAPEPTPPPPPD
jgi:hypothetical protein